MLYYYKTEFDSLHLEADQHLHTGECDDIVLLSVLCKLTTQEVVRRLANDHKAYVAFYNGMPAAFGWMAMGKAKVGELNHEIVLPERHRYLWNFRTLQEYRGLGIYPRLLQHILERESTTAVCFWILHAPENRASEKGILKAGFRLAGNVSVKNGVQVIFRNVGIEDHSIEAMIESLGFEDSPQEPASCWMCSSPYLAHKKTACCCTEVGKVCNEELFLA